MDPLSLAGRVAVVTGAGRGIGALTAKLLARSGAQVALLEAELERTMLFATFRLSEARLLRALGAL